MWGPFLPHSQLTWEQAASLGGRTEHPALGRAGTKVPGEKPGHCPRRARASRAASRASPAWHLSPPPSLPLGAGGWCWVLWVHARSRRAEPQGTDASQGLVPAPALGKHPSVAVTWNCTGKRVRSSQGRAGLCPDPPPWQRAKFLGICTPCPPSWPCTVTIPWDGTRFPAPNRLLLAVFIESVLCHLSLLFI